MTQEQFITELVGTPTLDLIVEIKDTAETKMTARFIGITFEQNSYVSMKLEVTVENKDVLLNEQGQLVPSSPITYTKMVRADERTQVPVVDQNDDPVLDSNNEPLTIPENIYWKYLAWGQILPTPLRDLLENIIKVKFNLIPSILKLQINPADFNF